MTTMLRHIPAVILTVALASAAHSEPNDCDKIPSYNDMTECFIKAAQSADTQLNSAYRKILAKVGKGGVRTLIVDAQRRWLAFRDAQCTLEGYGTTGGSIHPTVMHNCVERLTSARVKDLEYLLTCQEGDLSCPTR